MMSKKDRVTLRPLELYEVAISVTQLEDISAFYRDVWGLPEVSGGAGWYRLAGTHQSAGGTVLILGESHGLHHLAFRAVDTAHLHDLVDAMTAAGHTPIDDVVTHGVGQGVVFKDPDGNRIEIVVTDLTDRTLASPLIDRIRPRRLGHVVLGTPNMLTMEHFYQHLGFVVTDRTAPGMSFMRSNSDHHSLAFVPSSTSWLQHVAYDVGDVDNVMKGVAALATFGMRPLWGPGRHGPGRNVFAYFQDPMGTIIEYYGDLEQFAVVDADIEPKIWGPEHRGDTWGLAGAPPPAFFTPPSPQRTPTT